MIPLADSALPPNVDNWYSLVAFALVTVTGWATVIYRQYVDSKKLTRTSGQLVDMARKVDNVDTQVTNGGSNLAANVGTMKDTMEDALRLAHITRKYVETLSDTDMRIMRQDISSVTSHLHSIGDDVRRLSGDIANEREARAALEGLFKALQHKD